MPRARSLLARTDADGVAGCEICVADWTFPDGATLLDGVILDGAYSSVDDAARNRAETDSNGALIPAESASANALASGATRPVAGRTEAVGQERREVPRRGQEERHSPTGTPTLRK